MNMYLIPFVHIKYIDKQAVLQSYMSTLKTKYLNYCKAMSTALHEAACGILKLR